MTDEVETLNIYQIISKISAEAGALAPESKGGVPFPFRGIDGTVNHLAPLLQKYGVVVVPKVLEEITTERDVGNRVVKTTRVKTAFTFYAPDGSKVTAVTVGLADDFADRSAAQAQSVAFRVALLQTFTLPTQTKEPEETGQEILDHQEKTGNVSKSTAATAKPEEPTQSIDDLRKEIAKYITAGFVNAEGVNEIGDKIAKNKKRDWSLAQHEKILAELVKQFDLETGEVK